MLAVLVGLAALAPGVAAEEFQGRVVRVRDGDSLAVLRDGQPVEVRLHGIDAPEAGQPYGRLARQRAARLARGRVVTVHVRGRDRHDRLLADVLLPDGRSLGQELAREGLAWWFRRFSDDPALGDLEAEARAARRGLWAAPHPTPPWTWRAAHPRPEGALPGPVSPP